MEIKATLASNQVEVEVDAELGNKKYALGKCLPNHLI